MLSKRRTCIRKLGKLEEGRECESDTKCLKQNLPGPHHRTRSCDTCHQHLQFPFSMGLVPFLFHSSSEKHFGVWSLVYPMIRSFCNTETQKHYLKNNNHFRKTYGYRPNGWRFGINGGFSCEPIIKKPPGARLSRIFRKAGSRSSFS